MSKYSEEMKKVYSIWGRNTEVTVIFECYGKDTISKEQEATFEEFETHSEHYFNMAKEGFERYIAENYTNKPVDNIFKYIVPKQIFFKQYTEDKNCFGIICYFKFDMENGIAARFTEGNLAKIGPEQIL